MLTVGQKIPSFHLKAVAPGQPKNPSEAFVDLDDKSYAGKWLVLFAWPMDFTFVCPTEIAGYGALNGEFDDRDAQILGFSIDSEYVHLAWKRDNKDLTNIPFPLMADTKRELSRALGILAEDAGVALRATFIVDPDGFIRHVTVNDLNVGRNPQETLRVLDALQTDELCPCNWKPGQDVLKVA